MNVLIDKDKLALLQGRLGVSPSNDNKQSAQADTTASQSTPPPTDNKNASHMDNIIHQSPQPPTAGTHEVIDICDGSSAGGSRDSNREKPAAKGVVDWPKGLLRYEEHSNSSNSKHNRDNYSSNDEGKKENTPKRHKPDGVDPSPDGNNSRGAVTGMRKLETYFQSNAPSTFASSNRSLASLNTTQSSPSTVASAAHSSTAQGTTQQAQSVSVSSANQPPAANGSSNTNSACNSSSQNKLGSSSQHNEKAAAAAISAMTSDFKKQNDQLRLAKEQFEQKALRLEAEMRSSVERMRQLDDRNGHLSNSLEDVHRRMAIEERRRKRDRLAQDSVRLGKIVTVKTSQTSLGETWEEGYALEELNIRGAEVAERREELEKRRNRLKSVKRKYSAKQSAGNDVQNSLENNVYYDSTMASDTTSSSDSFMDLEIIAEESALRSHLDQLRKDESALMEARHLHEAEKAAHQKELKRCKSEDRSRFFKDLPCLQGRYLLLSLLGRGGFSEVWKALDLVKLCEVAVKIHQLNQTWSSSHKKEYVKHVTREYTIHRELKHPRVVLLLDVFEIDNHCFATILELCRGIDLDEKLKTQKTIPEKDAKTILMQIIFGLRYLHGGSAPAHTPDRSVMEDIGGGGAMPPPAVSPRRRSIIHFDLKPANILFDSMGDVKITDFGLSKITEEADMELTSQGAGTMWYLPPECFQRGEGPPRISSKVDVWSLGVILYEMLFGRRPFGEGMSQQSILSEGIVLNAKQVDFPQEGHKAVGSLTAVPKVSDEVKNFLRACLTWDQKHRPDIFQLCQDPYLRPPPKKL